MEKITENLFTDQPQRDKHTSSIHKSRSKLTINVTSVTWIRLLRLLSIRSYGVVASITV